MADREAYRRAALDRPGRGALVDNEAGSAFVNSLTLAFFTSLVACIGYLGVGWLVERNTQAWRNTR